MPGMDLPTDGFILTNAFFVLLAWGKDEPVLVLTNNGYFNRHKTGQAHLPCLPSFAPEMAFSFLLFPFSLFPSNLQSNPFFLQPSGQ